MESEACVAGVKGEAKKKREEEEGASSFFLVPRPSIPTLFPPPLPFHASVQAMKPVDFSRIKTTFY